MGDVVALREQPGQGDLCRCCTGLGGNGLDLGDDAQVALEILSGEARVGPAPVLRAGEAVYGVSPSGLAAMDWGRTTAKHRRVYLHVFNRPASGSIVVPMTNRPRQIYPLGTPATLLRNRVTPLGVEVELSPVTSPTPDPLPMVVVV